MEHITTELLDFIMDSSDSSDSSERSMILPPRLTVRSSVSALYEMMAR